MRKHYCASVFFLTVHLFLFSSELFSAPLKFVPITLQQPDGRVLNVYASGDEFYNWVHDKDNYTILQNPTTGFYVYAEVKEGNLVPTDYIVGRIDPHSTNLKMAENVFPKKNVDTRISTGKLSKTTSTQIFPDPNVPVVGSRFNLVIFIRFKGESEFSDPLSKYNDMLNNENGPSVKHYYKETSYNQINITSYFFPQTSAIISYQDTLTRNYYKKYNANTNPIGYTTDKGTRERNLLKRALEYIKPQIPSSANLDGNNDGFIDNVVFIVSGGPEAWSDLLWPHMSWYPNSNPTYAIELNSKKVRDYNFQMQTSISYSVLDHEMGHSLGLPDLYRYTNRDIYPIGSWDLMSSNSMYMNNYMKWKYLGWITKLTEINQSGTYWLKKSTSRTKNIYAIKSPRSAQEFFVLEYRSKEGLYEKNIPGSGLLIYRINNREVGNAYGPPDEIYVYRPYGTAVISGNINNANFGSDYGRTQINDLTNPSSFLSDGLPGGLSIKNISAVADSMSFDVEIINNLIEKSDYTVQATNHNWIDISQTGTKIANWMNGTFLDDSALDDGYSTTAIPLGFDFTFFNQKFSSIFVGINGVVSFTQKFLNFFADNPLASATQHGFFTNSQIFWPGNKYFPNSIGVAYSDLSLAKSDNGGGKIMYKTLGDKFILSWLNAGKSGVFHDTTNTFQLILDRSNNSITINYKNFGLETTRKELKIGMQKDQGNGIGWLDSGDRTERIPVNNSAIMFIPKSDYTITTICSPSEGGTSTGSGSFNAGQTISIVATAAANEGYQFFNWTEGGVVVATANPYSFNATSSRSLVANFKPLPLFDIQPAFIEVPITAGSVTFKLMDKHFIGNYKLFNISKYIINSSWISFSSYNDNDFYDYVYQKFNYSANNGAARVGQITITADSIAGSPKTVEIRQAGTTGIENIEDGIPNAFALAQNYPNPFNPSTIIKYGLPKQGHVKITIYDLIGRELINIVDQFQNAGYHEVELKLNGNNYSLSSGVYFYRMVADEFSETRKMIILK